MKKKRVLIPVVLCALLGAAAGGVWVRGTWAHAETLDPKTHADGIVRELLLTKEGRRVARGALVIDRPPAEVWDVLTDYRSYPEFMPNLAALTSSATPDGRVHLTGRVNALVKELPLDVNVTQDEAKHTIRWDEPGGLFAVNRGGWTLTPVGETSTLVVYELDVELPGYPAPFVRALVLHGVKTILKAVDKRVNRARRDAPPTTPR